MAIRHELVENLLNEARQELAKIDIQRGELIELIDNLQKYLPKQVDTDDIDREAGMSVGVSPVPHAQAGPPSTIYPPPNRVIGFKRKDSHAKRISEMLAQSGKTMKLAEIIAEYRKRGLKLTKNSPDILRTAIRNRSDLFVYREGGYVTLKDQQ